VHEIVLLNIGYVVQYAKRC